MPTSRDITAVCQRNINSFSNNCSGFVKAVAAECGVLLNGNANEIMDFISSTGSPWNTLGDGAEAKNEAAKGKLVVAGLKAKGHGHVVVVIDGPLHQQRYPYAFWGQYHGIRILGNEVNIGFTRGHGAISWAFGKKTRDSIVYCAIAASVLMTPQAGANEGSVIYF